MMAQEKMFGDAFLGQILTWVRENYDPEDVFTPDQLKEWVRENGFLSVELPRKVEMMR